MSSIKRAEAQFFDYSSHHSRSESSNQQSDLSGDSWIEKGELQFQAEYCKENFKKPVADTFQLLHNHVILE